MIEIDKTTRIVDTDETQGQAQGCGAVAGEGVDKEGARDWFVCVEDGLVELECKSHRCFSCFKFGHFFFYVDFLVLYC